MNAYLPGRVAEKYKDFRIVVLSSGNIYPFLPVMGGGATEQVAPEPIGEYAQSTLGCERIFEYHSLKNGTPMTMYRLNYAIEMRYSDLLELAKAVNEGREIDLTMGFANVIWQGDANSMALRCLTHCSSPPNEFAKPLDKEALFVGKESDTALLNNASRSHQWFGYPRVTLLQMIDWTAEWVIQGGMSLGKPTHFQERKGNF